MLTFEYNVSTGVLDALDAIVLRAEKQKLFGGEILLVTRCPEGIRHIPCLKRRWEIKVLGFSLYKRERILFSVDNQLHEDRKLRAAFFDKRIMGIAIEELTAFAEYVEATLEYKYFGRSAGT